MTTDIFSAAALRDGCLEFFLHSEGWRSLVEVLSRGPSVRHVHLYIDTAINPQDLERLIRAYFQAKRWPLTRRIAYIPGPGYVNIYNIHPVGKAHFEVIARFSSDTAIGLTPEGATHKDAGRNFVYWDDQYMSSYYEGFEFKTDLDRDDLAQVDAYFASDSWEKVCEFMCRPGSLHSHAQVRTYLHPELLKELGAAAMRKLGWDAYWGVSVVYQPGADPERPKVVYLLSRPETQMEIEWYFTPGVVLEAHEQPIALIKTQESTQPYFDELPYQRLSDEDIRLIAEKF